MAPEFVAGNRLTLLQSGGEYFPALLAAIDAAKHEVHLETYLFAEDATGRAVAAALSRAAGRGVRVRVLVDGFGAANFAASFAPDLLAAGVQALVYRPDIALFPPRRHRLRRMHRKLALIDGRVGFVGGINVIDDLNTPEQTPPRFDYAVRVEGPVLLAFERALRRVWEIVAWVNWRRRYRSWTPMAAPAACGTQTAALVVRDNLRHRRAIEKAYLAAIAGARADIIIASAYFLPSTRFLRALREAAARGVGVSLLLQGRVEFRLVHYATQALYDDLLAAGVRIFLYEKSFLHAKVAVVDADWATVGSSNIDPYSLLAAREANLVVRDANFTDELRRSLRAAMAEGARELPPGVWQSQSWPRRWLRRAAYALLSIAVGISGLGRRRS